MSEDEFLALVDRAQVEDHELNALQAGLLVGARLGIAEDSRSFARILGIAHALVLREVNALAEQEKLHIVRRDARTMRVFYAIKAQDAPRSGSSADS